MPSADAAPAPLASPAERSGNRLRLPARDDRSGAAVARPARRERRRGCRTVRRRCRRRFRQRTCACGRNDVLGGRPRPSVRDHAGRAGVSRPVERAAGRAERVRRPPGHPRDSDVARARGARRGIAAGHRAPAGRGRVGGEPCLAGCVGPRRHRSEPSRHRADRGDRAPGAAMRRTGPHGVRLSLRPGASPAGHRLQRRRAQA